jgi:hypothetical protein
MSQNNFIKMHGGVECRYFETYQIYTPIVPIVPVLLEAYFCAGALVLTGQIGNTLFRKHG